MIGTALGWLRDGGPVVGLLAAMSVATLALAAAKAAQLIPARRGAAVREAALTEWRAGRQAAARDLLAGGRTPADRVLGLAMAALAAGRGAQAARAAVERAGAAELQALARHLRLLDVGAATGPLLGLLGTVLGMIEAFRALEAAGGGANASVLAGGVWQALLTTAMGLVVAIPAGAAATLLAGQVDAVAHDIEDATAALLAAEAEGPGA